MFCPMTNHTYDLFRFSTLKSVRSKLHLMKSRRLRKLIPPLIAHNQYVSHTEANNTKKQLTTIS